MGDGIIRNDGISANKLNNVNYHVATKSSPPHRGDAGGGPVKQDAPAFSGPEHTNNNIKVLQESWLADWRKKAQGGQRLKNTTHEFLE